MTSLQNEYWLKLARARGVHLPRSTTRLTTRGMNHWLREMNMTLAWFRRWSGFKTLLEFLEANPNTPLREWAGLLLEEDDFEGGWDAFRKWEQVAISEAGK